MLFRPLSLKGAVLVELEPHRDERGFFARTFCKTEFAAQGLPVDFPQCNLSRNDHEGTLRGMHFNAAPDEESKLVRCVRGAIHDVIVDLRPDSETFLQWLGVDLNAEDGRALFVPQGFAHGFLTRAEQTDVFYNMGASYKPGAARGFRYDDPRFGIDWPAAPTVISERDATYPDFERGQ